MYSEDDLNSAVEHGVVPADTAQAFRDYVARRQQAPLVDEEHFRLITGFNDIFVVIACVLLLTAVGWIGSAIANSLGALAVAASAWGLAEYFTRVRRMALPSIVLLLAFVCGAGLTAVPIFGKESIAAIVGAAISAGAALAHWRRFRVPITIAAGTGAVIAFVFGAILAAVPSHSDYLLYPLSIIAGVISFTLAMRWDLADRERKTRKSDVAFWLHLLAAPLLVHPVFGLLGVFEGGDTPIWKGALVLLAYLAIGTVSLIVDRRALMVSALTYVLVTFSALVKQFGVVSLSFALTALIIGAALLLLSAFWQRCRHAVLEHCPPAWREKLPHAA